jgi:preprotein translocase subunit YajC
LDGGGGRFVADIRNFGETAFEAAREPVFRGFFDILWVPDKAPISGLLGGCKRRKSTGWRRCNWERGRYSPREFARTGQMLMHRRFIPVSVRIVRMLITPAFAQAAGAGDTNSMLMSLLPFALIFVIMYFLILRPQQKKVKDHAELVKNIRRGDTVVTSGGLVGKVTKVVDDDQIEFEISDGVRVRQMRQMISGVRAKGEPAKEKSETVKDETSAS